MSKHMPGPWIVTEEMGMNIIRAAEEPRTSGEIEYTFRDYVASTWGGVHEANALLIAAAPELLGALERINSLSASQFLTQADFAAECQRIASEAISRMEVTQ